MKIETPNLPILQAIKSLNLKRNSFSGETNLCKILALLELHAPGEEDIELVMARNPYEALIFPSAAAAFNIVLIALANANINFSYSSSSAAQEGDDDARTNNINNINSHITNMNNININIIAPKSLNKPFKNALEQETKFLGLNIAYYNDEHNYSNYYEGKPKGIKAAQEIKALINPETKLIIIEGQIALAEVKEIIKIAQKHNILTLMHNSTETPLFFKPLEEGIDISIYSLSNMGIISFSKRLVGLKNDSPGKEFYNEFCLKLYSSYENFAINVPEEDCLRLQEKLPILPLIMREKSQNALGIISWLKNIKIIEKVKKVSPNSGLILIILDKNYHKKAIENMFKHLRVFTVAENFSSLQDHIEYNSYIFDRLKQEERGKGNSQIIIGCGLEGTPALITDLERAFTRLITTEALLLQALEK